MNVEKFPKEWPRPEMEVPRLDQEIVETPATDVPDIRSIINMDDFDEMYPPLPSERERNEKHPGEPHLNS
jgi:hypothetical protein